MGKLTREEIAAVNRLVKRIARAAMKSSELTQRLMQLDNDPRFRELAAAKDKRSRRKG